MNGKWCAARFLNEQSEAGNGERPVDELGKLGRKHILDSGRVAFVDAARQRHMKAEVVHDMRITPERQILPLAFGQVLRAPAGNVGLGQGRAKPVEMVNDLSGKILQRLVGAIRNEREKRPECADDNTRNIEDGLAGRKLFEGGDEFRFAVFFGKLEGAFSVAWKP